MILILSAYISFYRTQKCYARISSSHLPKRISNSYSSFRHAEKRNNTGLNKLIWGHKDRTKCFTLEWNILFLSLTKMVSHIAPSIALNILWFYILDFQFWIHLLIALIILITGKSTSINRIHDFHSTRFGSFNIFFFLILFSMSSVLLISNTFLPHFLLRNMFRIFLFFPFF